MPCNQLKLPVEEVFCATVLHLLTHLSGIFEHWALRAKVLGGNVFFRRATIHVVDGWEIVCFGHRWLHEHVFTLIKIVWRFSRTALGYTSLHETLLGFTVGLPICPRQRRKWWPCVILIIRQAMTDHFAFYWVFDKRNFHRKFHVGLFIGSYQLLEWFWQRLCPSILRFL